MSKGELSYSRLAVIFSAATLFVAGVVAANIFGLGSRTVDSVEGRRISEAFELLRHRYVEEIDATILSESAIEGMLSSLDPHSRFISVRDVREVQEDLEGEFGGIGIWYQVIEDTARISSVMPNAPSEDAGLLPGDRIIGVGDSSVTGEASNGLQYLIKGKTNTDVRIKIYRPSVSSEMDFVVTRQTIPIFSVDGAYMIDEQTGYIKVGRFSVTTHKEFQKHVSDLAGLGMKRLILDLRNNPGGILEEAIKMSDELLGGEQRIVETRGRVSSNNNVATATAGDAFESQPLIVLVNENSASASEVVAGALQDNDRALLIGERTFGKALVQQQYQLEDGSLMHMTVSRYYTPTGRLIQTDYSSGNRRDYLAQKFVDSDSSSLRYSTMNGRDVAGGGGISPDITIEDFSEFVLADTLVIGLRYRNRIQRFARAWIDALQEETVLEWRNAPEETAAGFRIPDADVKQFWSSVRADSAFSDVTVSDINRVTPAVRVLMRAAIAQRLAGTNESNRIFNALDPYVITANRNWDRATALTQYHQR